MMRTSAAPMPKEVAPFFHRISCPATRAGPDDRDAMQFLLPGQRIRGHQRMVAKLVSNGDGQIEHGGSFRGKPILKSCFQ